MLTNTPQADPVEVALKACPFCGCGDIRLVQIDLEMTCQRCFAVGPHPNPFTEAEAITAWNIRTIPPTASSDLVERLQARAKRVQSEIDNCQRVVELMQPELDRFDAREVHNIYATRMAVDHVSSIRTLTKELADLTEAADHIATLETRIAHITEAAGKLVATLTVLSDHFASGYGDETRHGVIGAVEQIARTALQAYEASHAD